MFERYVCVKGEEAARFFYDNDLFDRKGVAPDRIKKTLFGNKGVQALNGEAHLHRKKLFMQFMSPDGIARLEEQFVKSWERRLEKWQVQAETELFTEVEEILTEAVCWWAKVPLSQEEVPLRASQFSAMVDGAATIGPRYNNSKRMRKDAEDWIAGLVTEVREGRRKVPGDSVLQAMSVHTNLKGQLLDEQVVAVEILNVLRPTVAIARYIVFAALALHEHPHYRQKLKNGEKDYYQWFVQEVRRFYPFFPFVVARARKDLQWQGLHIPEGRKVLLDLYATNHDPDTWKAPEVFYPERFKDWNGSPFNFIPQGGGDHYHNHRCAGEWVTITLTRQALKMLVERMEYLVPAQDFTVNPARLPAIPRDRMRLTNIRKLEVPSEVPSA